MFDYVLNMWYKVILGGISSAPPPLFNVLISKPKIDRFEVPTTTVDDFHYQTFCTWHLTQISAGSATLFSLNKNKWGTCNRFNSRNIFI